MQKFIPLSVPNIKGNELAYVTRALQEEWVSTSGKEISEFEKRFAAYLHVEHACAVQSGTAALHLCFRHFGIGRDDIVLVPTLTFIATINPVIYQSAQPIFFDCDEHLCLAVDQVARYLKEECHFDGTRTVELASGNTVKAIVPVHIFGEYADMERIMALAEEYHLAVIEDATEALGTVISEGLYEGRYAGTVSHAAAFSFNGNKIMTTGGGGMIVSNDEAAVEHMRYLSQQAKDDAVYFVNNEVGYNYRMTNLQAALGLGQLEQLNSFIETKRRNWLLYKELLADTPFRLLDFKDYKKANCWFYTLLTGDDNPACRDHLIKYLADHKIQTRPIWTLNHRQKPFAGMRTHSCAQAEAFYNQVVNLPCSSNLTEEEITHVCQIIKTFNKPSC